MRNILLTLFLFSFVPIACASEIENILGITPGSVSKITGTSTGGPFEILRIPTKDHLLSGIYPDLEVMISRESRKVVGVGSKRAYSDALICKKGTRRSKSYIKKVIT